MNKIRVFRSFLTVAAMALVIALISCSNPVFPDGSYTHAGHDNAWRVPGDTVIEQLEWLQKNAQSNGNYVVVARLNEPRIPGNNIFGICYDLRENITVTITTNVNLPRQTLRLLYYGAMLNVGPGNTLILDNVNLQVSHTPAQEYPVVGVHGGTLKMTNAVISGNSVGRGVIIREGIFSMGNGAVVHGNRGGVGALQQSRVYMYGNASVRNNTVFGGSGGTMGGGVFLDISTLTMRDNAKIYNNHTGSGGGVAAWAVSMEHGSHVYMFDNAAIRGNSAVSQGGGVIVGQSSTLSTAASTLNMHGNNVQISGNRTTGGGGSNHGGGVFLAQSRLYMSGGTIYGADAPLGLANTVATPHGEAAALLNNIGSFVRVGSFCSDNGFKPCGQTTFTVSNVDTTIRVRYGVLQ